MEPSSDRTRISRRSKGACSIALVVGFGCAVFGVGGAAAGDGSYARHLREARLEAKLAGAALAHRTPEQLVLAVTPKPHTATATATAPTPTVTTPAPTVTTPAPTVTAPATTSTTPAATVTTPAAPAPTPTPSNTTSTPAGPTQNDGGTANPPVGSGNTLTDTTADNGNTDNGSTGTTTTGTTTTGTTTTGSGSQTAACVAADLTPSFLGTNGAAGTIAVGFALKNTSSAPCHTYGWPGVEFLSSSGSALPTDAVRTTTDMLGATPASEITLQPGQKASFRLIASQFAENSNTSCATATALQIIAPDDSATFNATISGGIPACGKATLSPLMVGTSAWPKQ
jgi:hypothetical protein